MVGLGEAVKAAAGVEPREPQLEGGCAAAWRDHACAQNKREGGEARRGGRARASSLGQQPAANISAHAVIVASPMSELAKKRYRRALGWPFSSIAFLRAAASWMPSASCTRRSQLSTRTISSSLSFLRFSKPKNSHRSSNSVQYGPRAFSS